MSAFLVAVAVWVLVPGSVARRCRTLFNPSPSRRRLDPAIVTAALTPVVGLIVLGVPWGPVLGLGVAPLVHRSIDRLESSSSRRRRAQIAAQLPSALDLMVAMLAAGRPPLLAFEIAAQACPDPLSPELQSVAERLAVSADPRQVWTSLGSGSALAPLGRALGRAEDSGIPIAQVIAGVADELRRERRAECRQRAAKVGVRTAAPLGVCFLPAFFLVGIVPTLIGSFRSLGW